MEQEAVRFDERDAFVRARFGASYLWEGSNIESFRKPDIEDWLARQRAIDLPDEADRGYWRWLVRTEFMWYAVGRYPAKILEECATPMSVCPTHELPFTSKEEPLVQLIGRMCSEDYPVVRAYWPCKTGGNELDRALLFVYACANKRPKLYSAHTDSFNFSLSDANYDKLVPWVGLLILLAEWFYSRQKRREARGYLCDTVKKETRRLRSILEANFDRRRDVAP